MTVDELIAILEEVSNQGMGQSLVWFTQVENLIEEESEVEEMFPVKDAAYSEDRRHVVLIDYIEPENG